ncbi:MAG: thiamine pyrophosphate-binding protein [Proteobacteria bacterium]|nr:MAG: thiamine pyrophosphate-binding protein [Pseudomonadota bacterium]
MRRFDCLKLLASRLSDEALVVCNLQDTTYEWQYIRPSDGNLLRQGMAIVTPVALGIAMALPRRRVVALDGDGSMLLGPGVLTTLGRYAVPNLLTIIFDNENYNSGGVVPSATAFGADLARMARAAGVENAATVRTLEEFDKASATALDAPSMWVLVAKIDREPVPVPRPRIDGKESKYRFVRFIERIEGREILLADEQKSFS